MTSLVAREVVLPFPAHEVWTLLSDLSGHHRWIPLTTTSAPPAPPQPGDELVAVTLGVLPDRMTVTSVVPPGPGHDTAELLLVKTGPLLLGPVGITIRALGPGACAVDWAEDVWLRGPVPRRLTAAVLALPLRGMTRFALRRVRRHLEREHRAAATGSTGRGGEMSAGGEVSPGGEMRPDGGVSPSRAPLPGPAAPPG